MEKKQYNALIGFTVWYGISIFLIIKDNWIWGLLVLGLAFCIAKEGEK